MKTNKSQKETVLNALLSGKTLTTSMLTNSFRIASPSEVIRQLRSEGYAVYTNTNKDGKVSYRIGKPSRSMIAAAYNLSGSTLFTRNQD